MAATNPQISRALTARSARGFRLHRGDRRRSTRHLLTAFLGAAALTLTHLPAAMAQAWPSKPVRIVVGFPPGQATDVIARDVAKKLSESTGQNFFVENRPGAAGIIGSEIVKKADPDGYTLLMSSSGPLAVNPGLYANLPYHPLKDFAPVSITAIVPLFLVANPAFPPNNVQELLAYARPLPGRINYGSGGSGVTNHLAMEMFKADANLFLVHIPYKGGPPAVTDLIAGQISLMFETGPGVLPQVRAGKLKALAVGSAKRSIAMPALPTVAESGVPGFDGVAWVGLVAPAGTPKAVVDKLNAEVHKISAMPDIRERYIGLGAEPSAQTPEQFAAFIQTEMDKWGRVIKRSGARVD
jgi:tripartite-type tricarboxylate transporter receptor subunit TctC